MERDKYQCVLTKQDLHQLEVAHILPKKLHGKNRNIEWQRLQILWDKERVQEWQEEIGFSGQPHTLNTEQVKNLITFSVPVHSYWDECAIAFRPIELNETKTKMTVAFHWLPSRQ